MIPKKFSIEIKQKKLPQNSLFSWFKKLSNMTYQDMLSTFNCGIGMAFVISVEDLNNVNKLLEKYNEECFVIGKIIKKLKKNKRCIIV